MPAERENHGDLEGPEVFWMPVDMWIHSTALYLTVCITFSLLLVILRLLNSEHFEFFAIFALSVIGVFIGWIVASCAKNEWRKNIIKEVNDKFCTNRNVVHPNPANAVHPNPATSEESAEQQADQDPNFRNQRISNPTSEPSEQRQVNPHQLQNTSSPRTSEVNSNQDQNFTNPGPLEPSTEQQLNQGQCSRTLEQSSEQQSTNPNQDQTSKDIFKRICDIMEEEGVPLSNPQPFRNQAELPPTGPFGLTVPCTHDPTSELVPQASSPTRVVHRGGARMAWSSRDMPPSHPNVD